MMRRLSHLLPSIRWRLPLVAALVCVAGAAFGARAAGELRLESLVVSPPAPGVERVVREQAGLSEGQTFDAADLVRVRSRLQQSGWFERVEVYATPGSARGAVVVRVDAELDRGAQLLTGFGHEPLDGWYLNLVGVRWNHLLRPGSRLEIVAQSGLRRSGVRAEMVQPGLLGPRLDLLLRAEGSSEDWNVFRGDDFLQQQIHRGRTGLGLRWRALRGGSLTLRVDRATDDPDALERLDDGSGPLPLEELPSDGPSERWTSVGLDFVLDHRDVDQPFRRGSTLVLQGEVGLPDDDRAFARLRAEARTALPLAGESALALRAGGRWSDRETPYHLRPIFGGIGSVRGFRDASLSGPFGTRGQAFGSVELRTPLLPRGEPRPRVHGVLFGDVGSHLGPEGRWEDPSLGIGWGLRVRIPWIDHLGIDVGIPLTPTGTEDPFWVHGRLGLGF